MFGTQFLRVRTSTAVGTHITKLLIGLARCCRWMRVPLTDGGGVCVITGKDIDHTYGE